jgi:hypothetical protein
MIPDAAKMLQQNGSIPENCASGIQSCLGDCFFAASSNRPEAVALFLTPAAALAAVRASRKRA